MQLTCQAQFLEWLPAGARGASLRDFTPPSGDRLLDEALAGYEQLGASMFHGISQEMLAARKA